MPSLLQSRGVGVAASAVKDAAVPVAMRAGSPVRAGAWPEDADDLVAMWHTHDLHQLLYAFAGVVEETEGGIVSMVLKLHENGVAMAFPARSRIPVVSVAV